MRMWIGKWWMLGLAVGCAFAQSQNHVGGDLRLTVVVYDRADVSRETLSTAESTVERVFADAGVRLVWRDGAAYTTERHSVFPPPPEDPATLAVTLQPESEIRRYAVRSVCGGFAHDSSATVFVRRHEQERLGYLIAHELGHILLGPDAHAATGIMRATLASQEWLMAAQGTLGFTPSQNQLIRKWISQRARRESPVGG
jgi:hypothetical protein